MWYLNHHYTTDHIVCVFSCIKAKNKTAKADKDKAIKEVTMQIEKREQQRANEDKKRIATLERKIRELEAGGVKPVAAAAAVGVRHTLYLCTP